MKLLNEFIDKLVHVPVVGVDIGSTAIKVVEIEGPQSHPVIRRIAVRSIENRDPGMLLQQIIAELGITNRKIALGLASPEVIVRPFSFPKMPAQELKSAIRLEAEASILNGHLPDQMSIDWHQIPSEAAKENVRGIVAVVPRSVVHDEIKTAKAAQLLPAVVDVKGLALWNAYWILQGSKEKGSVGPVFMIHLGARTTNLVIADGPNVLMLVRDLDCGAELIRQDSIHDWLLEIHDSLAYARAKGGLRQLGKILVTGGGHSPELIETLQKVLNVPVLLWNPMDHILRGSGVYDFDNTLGPAAAIAVGLALRQP